MTARIALLCVALCGCVWKTGPSPSPPPQPPPPDGPGTCQTSAENLTKLGGCGEDMGGWEQRCADAEREDAEVGLRLPHGCWTAAQSCAGYHACR